ncbi:MAG: Asp-tRNA(Asn)/Glu-tRNA(Gln) amidotransferase GatCAB subunit C [Crocinitomicaceae bacterium]|nr:Asp-tRNA(Asn)/Glu-tRNA(Gln) amidotransferase GatCAB subunit C [Crocinitomicaceae bacterium]|tara:strand:- start:8323 stop:8616 length:294 start_codon:yes stop_codon:yes gene_type:complete
MKIDKKTVDKIAKLSKLEFNEEEGRLILNDMNKMLDFIGQLNELDTEGVEPLIHMNEELNKLRKDINYSNTTQKEALKNSPVKDSTYFKLPKVLDKK